MKSVYNKINSEEFLVKGAVFLSFLGFLAFFYARLLENSQLQSIIRASVYPISLSAFMLTLFSLRKKINKYDIIIIIYSLILVVWASFTQDKSLFTRYWYYVFLLSISVGLLTGKGRFSQLAARSLFLIICGTIFYLYIIQGYDQFNQGNLMGANRNTVAMYIVGVTVFVYLVEYISGKMRPLFWPSLIALWITTLTYSRTGTLIAILLFALVMVYNISYFYKAFSIKGFFGNKKSKVAAIILLMVLVLPGFFICSSVYKESRFSSQGFGGASSIERVVIYKEFFDQINFQRSLTGFKFDYKYNTHNSYLALWSYCGIAAFPVFIFLGLLFYRFVKRDIFFAGIFGLILLYSIPENSKFIRYHDFLVLSIIFYYFNKKDSVDNEDA